MTNRPVQPPMPSSRRSRMTRSFRTVSALLALFVSAASMSSAEAEDIAKPNIVFFMVDDFGRELIGAYGGETHATPHIDRLALEGMAFEIYYPEILAHRPFVPTDLSEGTGEDYRGRVGDASHFPEMVRYTDDIVGALREALERTGQAENTLFIFTSDNGTDNVHEAKGMTSRWQGRDTPGGKYLPTELGANVPLIAWWPGTVEAGSRHTGPVDFTDFHLTFARLAGAEAPEGLDGHDLTPVLTGKGDSTRDYAYTWGVFEYSSRKYQRPVEFADELIHILRDKRWKYLSDGRLYDLRDDPFETEPVPDEAHPGIRERMAAALEELRASGTRLW